MAEKDDGKILILRQPRPSDQWLTYRNSRQVTGNRTPKKVAAWVREEVGLEPLPSPGEAESIARLNKEVEEINDVCAEHGDAGKNRVDAVCEAYRKAGEAEGLRGDVRAAEAEADRARTHLKHMACQKNAGHQVIADRDATISRLRAELANAEQRRDRERERVKRNCARIASLEADLAAHKPLAEAAKRFGRGATCHIRTLVRQCVADGLPLTAEVLRALFDALDALAAHEAGKGEPAEPATAPTCAMEHCLRKPWIGHAMRSVLCPEHRNRLANLNAAVEGAE